MKTTITNSQKSTQSNSNISLKSAFFATALTLIFTFNSCTTSETWNSAMVGSGVGAAAGYVLGDRHGKPATGALIGAAAGGTLSGYQGYQNEKLKNENIQLRQRMDRLEQETYRARGY